MPSQLHGRARMLRRELFGSRGADAERLLFVSPRRGQQCDVRRRPLRLIGFVRRSHAPPRALAIEHHHVATGETTRFQLTRELGDHVEAPRLGDLHECPRKRGLDVVAARRRSSPKPALHSPRGPGMP